MSVAGNNGEYYATWESLDRRPVAEWYLDAKFGIYVHWTLSSVPAWGLHSSFYWFDLEEARAKGSAAKQAMGDSYDDEYAGIWEFHVKNYGANFKYEQFAPMWRGVV
jgi:alpha-L-fucosidase